MVIDATRLLTLHYVTTMNSTIGYYERCREFRRSRRARRLRSAREEQVDKFRLFGRRSRASNVRAPVHRHVDETLNV